MIHVMPRITKKTPNLKAIIPRITKKTPSLEKSDLLELESQSQLSYETFKTDNQKYDDLGYYRSENEYDSTSTFHFRSLDRKRKAKAKWKAK